MELKLICEQIEGAGAWLPLTVVRQAFTQHAILNDRFLEAVQQRAISGKPLDVGGQRLVTFGVFFLGQRRDGRLLDPLVRLFETCDFRQQDEWLFSSRLFFFGHRLLAGVCASNPQGPLELALDATKTPTTHSLAIAAICLQAAYCDLPRATAVDYLRRVFSSVKALPNDFTVEGWALTAAKLHSREFERELQWCLASGRLSRESKLLIAASMRHSDDNNFKSIVDLDGMVDMFSNVFPREIRAGECGLLPNGDIPRLEMYAFREPHSPSN